MDKKTVFFIVCTLVSVIGLMGCATPQEVFGNTNELIKADTSTDSGKDTSTNTEVSNMYSDVETSEPYDVSFQVYLPRMDNEVNGAVEEGQAQFNGLDTRKVTELVLSGTAGNDSLSLTKYLEEYFSDMDFGEVTIKSRGDIYTVEVRSKEVFPYSFIDPYYGKKLEGEKPLEMEFLLESSGYVDYLQIKIDDDIGYSWKIVYFGDNLHVLPTQDEMVEIGKQYVLNGTE